MMEIIPLNPELIHRANYNSFGGTRGDSSNEAYLAYGREVLGFPIADGRKEKLLAEPVSYTHLDVYKRQP